ncbi:MAG: serine/threonine protein kinase [Anaerolineae bacterium]|nr:serine/threonine protein kinase [Anaerolineae bacterium]
MEKYIGRYEIIQQIGEGGMATVYRARDTRLEREVAIKVIRSDQALSEKFLLRFEREAKALAKLNHPNIVRIYDYGEHEGRPYLVMDYLSGGTLRQKMGHPMPYTQAAGWLAPIARALEYAHRMGIVHRDIKPSNVLLSDDGRPMLGDFGVAKLLESEELIKLTKTGMGIGTPEYMSPEQCYGENIDHRSDIYSLGIVLYECVVGCKPFSADSPMEVMVKQASEPPVPPRTLLPELPQHVEEIILRAIQKRAEQRFQNMGVFAAALESLILPLPEDLNEVTLTDRDLSEEEIEQLKAESRAGEASHEAFETMDDEQGVALEKPTASFVTGLRSALGQDKSRRILLIVGSIWALIMLAMLIIGGTVLITWGVVELAHYLRAGSVW